MTGGALHLTIDHGDDRLLVVVHPTGEHEVAVDMGDHAWQPVEFVPEKVEVRAEGGWRFESDRLFEVAR